MSENDSFGSEQNIDVSLPPEPADNAPRSRAEKRAAIAQARAIRREAAAKEREAKKRAAAEAKALVADVKTSAKKKDRKSSPKGNTLTNTGVIQWLESLRKTEKSGEKPKKSSVRTDTATLVAELAAARAAVQKGTDGVTDPDALLAAFPGSAEEEHRSAAKAIVEKIAAEVAAEQAAAAERSPNTSQEAAEAIVGEIAAKVEAGEALPETESVSAEPPQAEPMPEIPVGQGRVVDAILARIAEDEPETPPAPEAAQRSYAETIAEAQPEPARPAVRDNLQPAFDAETARAQEKRRLAAHAEEMEAAALQYRKDTADAKTFARRLQRKFDRTWNREANAEQAKTAFPKTHRMAAVVNATLCLVMLFGIAAGMVVLERPTVSESENRMLAKKPDFSVEGYLDGSYTNEFAEYYNDTVPLRELFKDITGSIRQYMGLRTDNAVIHDVGKKDQPPEEPEVTTVTTEDPLAYMTSQRATETAAEQTQPAGEQQTEEDDEGEFSNHILIVNKRGIPIFGGNYSGGERYASYINKYQEQLGSGVQVWSMVVPTPCSFYTPEKYQSMVGSEEKNIEHINEYLNGVRPVDVYSALEKHSSETIFMRTDHHWSALGAFYAAEEFAKTARVPFARITEYDRVAREGYVGTLYGFSGHDITLKNNPEEFFYYVPHASYETTFYSTSLTNKRKGSYLLDIDRLKPVSWYLVYMGTDETVAHIETEVKNGRKLAIIKDSYGNALAPWLTSSFEEITVFDMRYFKKNAISYLKELGVTDVLFAMNTFSAVGGNAKGIEKIRTQ